MYIRLAAAIADAARCDGRHDDRHTRRTAGDWRECRLCVAHRQADAAYAGELLPAVLGGEWKPATNSAWSGPMRGDDTTGMLFDHDKTFRRRDATGPHRWNTCAIVSQPFGPVLHDGVFHPGFVAGAQALWDRHGVGVWVSRELSAYSPGRSVLVLMAKGLVPERAARSGFHTPNIFEPRAA